MPRWSIRPAGWDPESNALAGGWPKRMFWGTDITRMPSSYRQCLTPFTEELSWLKGRDLENVMGRGLCQWIGWDCFFK